jgi:hypothetical protein
VEGLLDIYGFAVREKKISTQQAEASRSVRDFSAFHRYTGYAQAMQKIAGKASAYCRSKHGVSIEDLTGELQ